MFKLRDILFSYIALTFFILRLDCNAQEYTPFYKNYDYWITTSIGASILLMLILSILAWNRALKTRVRLRTKRLEEINRELANEIEERKRAEEALRKNQKTTRVLLNLPIASILLLDRNGFILDSNETMAKRFHRPVDALIGTCVWDLLPSGVAQIRKKNFVRALKTGETIRWEDRRDEFYFDNLFIPIIEEYGFFTRVIACAIDITERKQTESANLALKERIERSKKMEGLGLLAGSVAHDLNNILSGIVSYPDLLLMDIPEGSKLRRPLETIMQSGLRARDVVDDLLTLTRGIAMHKEPLSINGIINHFLKLPEYEEFLKDYPFVKVSSQLDPTLFNINGSPIHIQKALMNLVFNAIEAIDPTNRGIVTISTGNIELTAPVHGFDEIPPGSYVRLDVADNGGGIASEDLERVFDPFYTKKVMGRSGTGLGLCVTWNTIKDHNGFINLKSTPQGTTFSLYFPITDDVVVEERTLLSVDEIQGDGQFILIVDDEPLQRKIASEMLNRLGYRTAAVSSGEEAVSFLKNNAVDLVLLDMIMPGGLNGRETYKQLLKINPRLNVIIVSGFSKTEEMAATPLSNVDEYIKKPYNVLKIGLAVKTILNDNQS